MIRVWLKQKVRYVCMQISNHKLRSAAAFIIIFLQVNLAGQIHFADNIDSLDAVRSSLSQAGSYRFVYRMFFKLYDARFYTDATQGAINDKLLNGKNTLLLEFDYLRKIKKSIILKSSKKILAKNMTPTELASIQQRVDRINVAYRTVNQGDRSALLYVPGKGTTLWINEKPVITLEGEDFVRLYFRIWLGEYPISKPMRDALLQHNLT